MKLSVSIYVTDLIPNKRNLFEKLVKRNVFDEHSVKTVFARLKSSGVDGIELLIPLHFSESDFQYIQKILDENNVIVNTIHQPLQLFSKLNLTEIEKLFTIAHRLNARIIILHLSSAGKKIYDKDYLKTLHKLETKYNIRIGFENHQKHFILAFKKHLWDSKKFSNLLQNINFGITLDTTHLATTGRDIVSFLNENLKSIVNIHLSDYKNHPFSASFRPIAFTHMPLGSGELPITDFLKLLKRERYNGFITLEINTNLDGLCESAKIVKKV